MQLIDRLGDKYQVDELAAKYEFTGRTPMTVPKAMEIKEELEEIDRLLKQLEEAAKTAQIGVIDMEALAEYAEPGDMEQLNELAAQIEQYLRTWPKSKGWSKTGQGYRLTPKAYRLFQGRLLERIFSNLEAARTGRHQGPIVGEGAVELQQTKPYEFGDSLANMDIPGSLINAMLRDGPGLPLRMRSEDIIVHRTRNTPKCATAVLLDMSGSMRYDGLYVNVKRMGLALDGLIRREYPGDWLRFIEVYTFAKLRQAGEVVTLAAQAGHALRPGGPPEGRHERRADERDADPAALHQHPARPAIGPATAGRPGHAQPADHPHYRRPADGPFRRARICTCSIRPTARTEEATLREGQLCRREGITINIFLLQSWWQSSEDVQFAQKLSESTTGRVFFTAGKDLDRYVVWDYVKRRREIVA